MGLGEKKRKGIEKENERQEVKKWKKNRGQKEGTEKRE